MHVEVLPSLSFVAPPSTVTRARARDGSEKIVARPSSLWVPGDGAQLSGVSAGTSTACACVAGVAVWWLRALHRRAVRGGRCARSATRSTASPSRRTAATLPPAAAAALTMLGCGGGIGVDAAEAADGRALMREGMQAFTGGKVAQSVDLFDSAAQNG
eukprot:TRINITY_DN15949_c0_g1_i2.p1 TRINITY_DN15949_c0_g1~~TRINITY_DN15949_c0_g1_i2.p1  ORF type:complete len:158 (+),score=33.07 TRINITY_DN15949_c0_g1_i2:95-568(+)